MGLEGPGEEEGEEYRSALDMKLLRVPRGLGQPLAMGQAAMPTLSQVSRLLLHLNSSLLKSTA